MKQMLTITKENIRHEWVNGDRKILYQRDDPGFDVFKVFEVSEEDVQNIIDLLEPTSIKKIFH